MNDAGIFAYPADACLGGHSPLDQGTGVDVAARLAGESLAHSGFDLTQTAQKLIVIVRGDELVRRSVCGGACGLSAPRITCNPAGAGGCAVDREGSRGVVVQGT